MNNNNLYSEFELKESQYQDVVLNLLYNHKNDKLIEDELIQLQLRIEDLTTTFGDIKSIYQATLYLSKKLISENQPTAKDFLK